LPAGLLNVEPFDHTANKNDPAMYFHTITSTSWKSIPFLIDGICAQPLKRHN